jgi:hypothetical protein
MWIAVDAPIHPDICHALEGRELRTGSSFFGFSGHVRGAWN